LLFSALPASAARVLYTAGSVQVETSGKRREVKKGAEISPGDAILTGSGALAIIALDDGSRIKLRENSKVVLEQADDKGSRIYLDIGGVFAKIKKLTAGRQFKVRTHSAVAAVRGTEFFTAYGRKTRRGHDMWACVNEGAIELTSAKEAGAITVKQGEGVLVKNGSSLTKPRPFDWTKTLNWSMEPETGNVEDKTDLGGAYADLLDRDYR
jgi:ferric-dicitrate binding protein FerR (iron transport regulator)